MSECNCKLLGVSGIPVALRTQQVVCFLAEQGLHAKAYLAVFSLAPKPVCWKPPVHWGLTECIGQARGHSSPLPSAHPPSMHPFTHHPPTTRHPALLPSVHPSFRLPSMFNCLLCLSFLPFRQGSREYQDAACLFPLQCLFPSCKPGAWADRTRLREAE